MQNTSDSPSDSSKQTNRSIVRVSATPSIASNWLAHRIGEFHSVWPHIDLDLQATSAFVDLESDDVDVAIRFIDVPLDGYYCAELLTEPLFPVCSPLYLEKVGALAKPSDLERTVLLRCPRMQSWTSWFEAAGLNWKEPVTGPSFNEYPLLLDAAANGAGVALVGEILSASFIRSGRLVRLFDIMVPQLRRYFIVCRPSKLSRPDVAAFIDWLLSEAQEHVFKGAEERLRAGRDRLQAIVDNLPAGAIYIEGNTVTVNKAVEAITGYHRDEIRSLDEWFEKLYGRRSAAMKARYQSERRAGGPINRTSEIQRKDGIARSVEFSCLGGGGGEVWLMHDVTDRKEIEDRMRDLAYHDFLTSLPNRVLFTQKLDRALERARSMGQNLAVLYIDLDGFKAINDRLGHDAGDEVLKEVARRLKQCLRSSDTAARLGGDEFAVLLEEVGQAAEGSARRILSQLGAPIPLKSAVCNIGASIGISIYPSDAITQDELLERADSAMYEAKRAGKNCIRFPASRGRVSETSNP